MIRIGFPKGNLLSKSKAIIGDIIKIETVSGVLSFGDTDGQYQAFLLKHRDMPGLLQKGKLDYAIVSTEWIEESEKNFDIVDTLGWSSYRMCLIVSPDHDFDMKTGPKTCVTEFPNHARAYAEKMGWHETEIVVVSGSSEALVPSLYDCCIDCVETGETIRKHNLVILDTISETDVVLIGRQNSPNLGDDIYDIIRGKAA